jgi:hypothetical protein
MVQVYGEAICHVARCGASRCGNYQPRTIIKLGATDISGLVHKASIKITDIINEQPSTAAFEMRLGSVTPLEGNSLTIYLGTTQHPIFGGRILSTSIDLPRQAKRYPRMTVNCVDATWDIDTQPHDPLKATTFTSVSVTSLLKIMLDETEATYTESSIEPDMPVLPSFTLDLSTALSSQITTLMRAIGGWWFVDAARVTHAFVTAADVDKTPLPLTDASAFWSFNRQRDVSQLRTDYNVICGGGTVQAIGDLGARRAVYMDSVAYYSADQIGFSNNYLLTEDGPFPGTILAFNDLVDSINATSMALITSDVVGGPTLKYCPPGTKLRNLIVGGHIHSTDAGSIADSRMGLSTIATTLDDDTLGYDAGFFVGQAQLATFDDFEDTITYTTRDKWTESGKVVNLSIASPVAMSGAYVVQRVELSHFDEAETKGPQRQVTLGTNKRDLNDLLRRLIQGRGRG